MREVQELARELTEREDCGTEAIVFAPFGRSVRIVRSIENKKDSIQLLLLSERLLSPFNDIRLAICAMFISSFDVRQPYSPAEEFVNDLM